MCIEEGRKVQSSGESTYINPDIFKAGQRFCLTGPKHEACIKRASTDFFKWVTLKKNGHGVDFFSRTTYVGLTNCRRNIYPYGIFDLSFCYLCPCVKDIATTVYN